MVVALGPFVIQWYGLLYVCAFAVAYWLIGRLQRYRGLLLSPGQLLELLTWGAVGVVVGGRLGYVLLYEPLYYVAHPWEIIQLSHGGMSSHGGFIGVAIAVWIFSNHPGPAGHPSFVRRGKTYFSLFDIIAVPAALGLALGRLGNVINQELYVAPAAQAAAIGFPLLIAGVCYWQLRRDKQVGRVIGLFLVFYSLARWGEEYLREPQWPLVFGALTRGQLYTIPLLVIGLWLLRTARFAVWSKDEAG